MGRDERQLRRMRGEALSRLLQGLTYSGCLVIFYALMAIPNWPLRNLSRTSATTLVTWVAMGAAMLAVFGRMTVRRGKHQQQAAVHGRAHHGRGDVSAIADYERQS